MAMDPALKRLLLLTVCKLHWQQRNYDGHEPGIQQLKTPSVNLIAAKRGVKVPSTKLGFGMPACVIARLRGKVSSCLSSISSRSPSLRNLSDVGPYMDLST
jgi:hypothetical protein